MVIDPKELYYAKDRAAWRKWLEKNHSKKKGVWLRYYKKHSGKPRVEYGAAVEEALCFGWIDSTVKTIDADSYAQRFTPRKARSGWSEPNKERFRRLIKEGKVAPAGLAAFRGKLAVQKLIIPADILTALERNKKTWANFSKFPAAYKRIRIHWIDAARSRPAIFKQRLDYFIKMTAQNKRYGMLEKKR